LDIWVGFKGGFGGGCYYCSGLWCVFMIFVGVKVAIPGSRLKESEGLSPAQLSPPSGTATACCFHIASGVVGVGFLFLMVVFLLIPLPPPDLPRWGRSNFRNFIPPFGRNLF
jgi:hypothetical protein